MITKENKDKAFAVTRLHKDDVGSVHAQISVLTARIAEITNHMKSNRHDFAARRGLLQLVGRRKKFLRYLEEKDFEAYKDVIAKLGLRK